MGIKSFDYFRKLNTENETSTILGGLLTLIGFIFASVLVYNETKLFLTPDIQYSAVIDNDSLQFMNIQIDITVKVPCLALSLDQQDEVGVHRLDVQDTLKKVRQTKDGNIIIEAFGDGVPNYQNSQHQLEDLKKALSEGEICRFQGNVRINKVPGNFHISYHAQHVLMQRLYTTDIELYKKLKLDHIIHELRFGGEDLDPELAMRKQMFSSSFQKQFFKFMEIKKTSHQYYSKFMQIQKVSPVDHKNEYEYFLNTLPARFYDSETEAYQTLYKYSMTQAQAPKSLTEVDAMYFKYQINPVNMVYEVRSRNFYHFIVQLCAIVGGVFSFLGLFNQVLQSLE